MALKFYISVTKELKQKVRNFCFVYMCVCVCVCVCGGEGMGEGLDGEGVIPTFVEVTGKKLVLVSLFAPLSSILNRTNLLPCNL